LTAYKTDTLDSEEFVMQWTATCADDHMAENVARDLQIRIDPKYAEAIEREYAYGSMVMQECRWELADA